MPAVSAERFVFIIGAGKPYMTHLPTTSSAPATTATATTPKHGEHAQEGGNREAGARETVSA
jgi:hypothetical protein